MPVVRPKPNTLKYRGVLRAQMQRGYSMVSKILKYNAKLAAKVPDQSFMLPQEVADFTTVKTELANMLKAHN
jgi:hypothetical protein